jgi:hypothetical protein
VAFWIRSPLNYAGGDLPFLTTALNSTFGDGIVFAYTYGPPDGNHPGGWAFSIYNGLGTGAGVGGRGEIGSINDGLWHHLVHVVDRVAGITTYLDGRPVPFEKQAGTRVSDAGDIDTGYPPIIGQDPSGLYPENGEGDIDDLGIWRRALTPLEATSLYMAATAGGLSFTGTGPEPPSISIARSGASLTITYTGTLQSAPDVTGPYTDVQGAQSPYPVPTTAEKAFFRTTE